MRLRKWTHPTGSYVRRLRLGRAAFSVVKLFHLHKVLCQGHRRGRGQSGWLGLNSGFLLPKQAD